MNKLTNQQRKFAYLVGILILLIPIVLLGMPASDQEGRTGGYIARLRHQEDLGDSDLGELDPSGAAMNLALVGLRGVAANVLWMQAENQKNHKDWAQLRVTTESIIRLQPHYVKVWEYNGWNLAYNVAAEWDAVPDRYLWVKEGGKFLQRGVSRNEKSPDLRWHVGRIYGPKIGIADEARYYRRYFRQDPDPKFNNGPDPDFNDRNEDHYLVAKTWFQQANEVEGKGIRQSIMDKSIFRSYPARSQLDYAAALYKYGFNEEFDREVGDRKLTDAESDELAIRVREKLRDITREAWEIGFEDWVRKYGQELITLEFTPGVQATLKLEMTEDEIRDLGKTPEGIAFTRRVVDQYQKMNNYRYWRTRALCESEAETAEAHWKLFAAIENYRKQNMSLALKEAGESMALFEKIVQRFPELQDEDNFVEEVLTTILVWQFAHRLSGEKQPEQFPLKEIWDARQQAIPDIQQRLERRFVAVD
jgi:hypothetical protein